MKRLVIAAAFAAAVGAPALAADMPAKAPRYAPPPAFSWTGCYVGANVGAGWQKNKAHDPNPGFDTFDLGSGTDTGIVGGGQVGCDYQFAGSGFVVGAQGMFDGTGIDGSFYFPFAYSGTTTQSYTFKTDWLGTLTGRIGYAIAPQALLYVKGGGAWVHTKYTNADPNHVPPYVGTASADRSCWLVGGGLEYAFWRNWSVFVEYSYMEFGTRNLSFSYNCGAGCGFSNPYVLQDKQTLQTVLLGVNWRFGGL